MRTWRSEQSRVFKDCESSMTTTNSPGHAYDSVVVAGRILAAVHVVLGVIASFSVWNFRGSSGPAFERLRSWCRVGHDCSVRVGLGPVFGFLDLLTDYFGRQPKWSVCIRHGVRGYYRCGSLPLSAPIDPSGTASIGHGFRWRGALVASFGKAMCGGLEADMARWGAVTKWSGERVCGFAPRKGQRPESGKRVEVTPLTRRARRGQEARTAWLWGCLSLDCAAACACVERHRQPHAISQSSPR